MVGYESVLVGGVTNLRDEKKLHCVDCPHAVLICNSLGPRWYWWWWSLRSSMG